MTPLAGVLFLLFMLAVFLVALYWAVRIAINYDSHYNRLRRKNRLYETKRHW